MSAGSRGPDSDERGDPAAPVPPPARLTASLAEGEGRITVEFAGDMDLDDAGRIGPVLGDAVDRAEHSVVVDLRQVTFLGSTWVRLLLEARNRAHGLGREFSVVLGSGPAHRVIELLQLEGQLDVIDPRALDALDPRVHIQPWALAASLEALEEGGSRAASTEEALEQVAGAARRLFAVSGVGILLVDGEGELREVVSTDPPAHALEAAQSELGEGPCIDCFVLDQLVSTGDLAADARWPRLSARLAGAGVRAVLGVPTRLGPVPVGSLNVYRESPYAWDESDLQAVQAYNEIVQSTLGTAIALRRTSRVVAQLQEALDGRIPIERAVGVLMGRHGIDAVTAFNRLRSAARRERRRVSDLAGDLLEGTDVPGLSSGGEEPEG